MKTVLTLIFILVSVEIYSQDIEKIINKTPKDFLKGKGIEVKGGLDATSRLYRPFGLDNRLPSFQYIFSGRLQVDIFEKIKMPISFSYTNEKANLISNFGRNLPNLPYTQPFNRISLKPSYKGHKLYLGTNMMNFSSFTLANYRFEGIGYEYKSSKFPIYGGAMFGTFKKPIPLIMELSNGLNKPAYKRNGYAVKIGYQEKLDFVEISFLNSYDLNKSIITPLDSLNIFPQKNTAISTKFQKVFSKKLFFSGEMGRSVINDVRNIINESSVGGRISESIRFRNSNLAKTALKANIDYKVKNDSYGLEYSNVAPDYNTFGSYFFNNDLETFALKSNNQMLNDKIAINTSLGLQQNTRKSLKPQATKRWVGAIDATYKPSEKLNIAMNYSNFSDYTNLQSNYLYLTAIDPFTQLDTLNYRQINQNLGLTIGYSLPDKEKIKRAVSAVINYQAGDSEQGNLQEKNSVINANLGYSIQNEEKKFGVNYAFNILYNSNAMSQDFMYGPVLNLNKSFLKDKLKANTSLIYNLNNSQSNIGEMLQKKRNTLGNIGFKWNINKQHALEFATIFLTNSNKTDKQKIGDNFKEITFNLNYKYNFKGLSLKF